MVKFKKVVVLGVPFTILSMPQKKSVELICEDGIGLCDDLEDRIVLA